MESSRVGVPRLNAVKREIYDLKQYVVVVVAVVVSEGRGRGKGRALARSHFLSVSRQTLPNLNG